MKKFKFLFIISLPILLILAFKLCESLTSLLIGGTKYKDLVDLVVAIALALIMLVLACKIDESDKTHLEEDETYGRM